MADTAAVNLASQTLFRGEYELELESWLRRRFRGVCICYMIVSLVVLILRVPSLMNGQSRTLVIVTLAAGIASFAVPLHFLRGRHWSAATREQLLRGASSMILLLGAISLVKGYILEFVSPDHRTEFIVPLFFWHFIACLFLPWRPRESLRPVLPLLTVWAIGVMLHLNVGWWPRITSVIFSPIVLGPGVAACAIRLHWHSENFRSRMLGKHFLTMRQEFAKARSIHESMFPAPHDDGFVRFEYTYTPMRELGGDYVHLEVSPEGIVHLVLLDVTGHGLPSALTVNRLYGELERIRAESPLAEPGEVLSLLNRYINLTLVKHNIFVTALCLTLDPYRGKLQWASAGHPPAFLRGANGVVATLPATAILLGALEPGEFVADQQMIELSPGDVIVAYTDGAFEARDRSGRALGLGQLTNLLHNQHPPRNWPQHIASAVQRHSSGRTEDDILVASLTFLAPRTRGKRIETISAMAAS